MKIAELLARDKNSSTAIHEAIARAQAAGTEARGRMAELDRKRREALLADDERSLDRLEATIREAERDADRADLAVIELRDRLKEALDRERTAALDVAYERGTAAQQKAVGLIQKNYTKLAGQLRDLMLELRNLDQVVKGANAELERAADQRRVKEPDTVARSQDNLPVRVLQKPLYEAVVLPSPANPIELLYPATDIFGSKLERAA
jgi:hypothetical protein